MSPVGVDDLARRRPTGSARPPRSVVLDEDVGLREFAEPGSWVRTIPPLISMRSLTCSSRVDLRRFVVGSVGRRSSGPRSGRRVLPAGLAQLWRPSRSPSRRCPAPTAASMTARLTAACGSSIPTPRRARRSAAGPSPRGRARTRPGSSRARGRPRACSRRTAHRPRSRRGRRRPLAPDPGRSARTSPSATAPGSARRSRVLTASFIAAPVPSGPRWKMRRRERLEDRPGPLQVGRLAADHQRELAGLGRG